MPLRRFRFIPLFAVVVLTPTLLLAQRARSEDTLSPSPVVEETVSLSPFVVTSTTDNGYQASSTLAGTRLNTPVKDLGASISIFTKDLLDDLGATNSNDLLVYAAGMEAAGPNGNYSGTTNDINSTQLTGDGSRVNPQTGTRTRGLAAPNFARGLFATDITFDAYNSEAVTVSRGPNAILFGVGSPAGVVDTTLLAPRLDRDAHKIISRVGDNGSLRHSLDSNWVLIPHKLGFRLAALHDREEYNQRPAFEEKKRIYGALTFQPTRTTAFRGNFEAGNTKANRPISVLPFDSISSAWYAAGRPGYDWSFYDDPTRNPSAATQNAGNFVPATIGAAQLANQVILVYNNPGDAAPTFGFRQTTPNTSASAANAVLNTLVTPLVNLDRAADTIRFLDTLNIFQLAGTYWTADRIPANQQPGFIPAGLKMQGFTDYSAFDFRNRLIDETSRQGDSFHTVNLALEQRAWEDRIGIELAYDAQRADRFSKNSFFRTGNASHVRVDPNLYLPNGQLNPNYGRPFVLFGQSNWTKSFIDRETRRLTGYLKYDFKDLNSSWGHWLGRHSLTGLYEEFTLNSLSYDYYLATDGDAARATAASINASNRRASILVYLGPSLIGNNNGLQLSPIRIPELQAGSTAASTYFKRAANTTDIGGFVSAPTTLVEVLSAGTAQREVIKSQAAVLQSYWLKDHFVSLVGWRRDEDFFARQSVGFVANPGNSNDPGKVHYGFNDFVFPRTPPPVVAEESLTYSGVLRWPQRWMRLPSGTDASVFFNRSENFTPLGGRVNGFGARLDSPRGRTTEYGINLSLFDGRLSIRANRFETSVNDQTFFPTAFTTVINNGILQTASIWAQEGNINPHLVAMRNADIELLFSALPGNFRELYNFRVTGAAPTLNVTYDVALPGVTDTTDYTAKGTEYEIVYNPTRNWRIMASVAEQETIQSNSLPFLKQLVTAMTPIWNQLGNRARNNYPQGWQPGDTFTTQTLRSYIDSTVMVPYLTAIATEGSASAEQSKWRVNLIANYTFGRGSPWAEKLKGWSVGGGVRWQDKSAIGYPTSRNADSSVSIDIDHPYYNPATTNIDGWIGYTRKIFRDRINWKVQLNVRNIAGDGDPIAISAQMDGTPAVVRLPPERRWYLTNTFTF